MPVKTNRNILSSLFSGSAQVAPSLNEETQELIKQPATSVTEKNEEYLLQELSMFLSKKGNTQGSLQNSVIKLWFYGELNTQKINALYNGPYLSSELNKIYLKLVLMPQEVLISFSDKCLSREYSNNTIRTLGDARDKLQIALQEQQSFACFIKLELAKNIYNAQLQKVKDKELAPAFTREAIDCSYEEKWKDLIYKGSRECIFEARRNSPSFLMFEKVMGSLPLTDVVGDEEIKSNSSTRTSPETTRSSNSNSPIPSP